jgi:hypothetical protein
MRVRRPDTIRHASKVFFGFTATVSSISCSERAMHFHLGKVFISHTTADKPFVRRLAARLEKSHFHTWLDERDLIAGDPLPQSIAKALQAAKVILGIISKASAASNWLQYELNLATEVVVGAAPASIEGETGNHHKCLLPPIERLKFTPSPKGYPIKLLA